MWVFARVVAEVVVLWSGKDGQSVAVRTMLVLRASCGSMDGSHTLLVGKPTVALIGATVLPNALLTWWCVRRRGRFL